MEYAKTVDRAYCGGTLHTSFQIRLPYVKGMLHQVDFKEFLSCAGMKTITDLWGTVHDVANVDIILTKSMSTASWHLWNPTRMPSQAACWKTAEN